MSGPSGRTMIEIGRLRPLHKLSLLCTPRQLCYPAAPLLHPRCNTTALSPSSPLPQALACPLAMPYSFFFSYDRRFYPSSVAPLNLPIRIAQQRDLPLTLRCYDRFPNNFLSLRGTLLRIIKSADQQVSITPPETQGPEERARIVDAICARNREMMMHRVQQLGRSAMSRSRHGPEERRNVVACMHGRIIDLARNCCGCHALQRALDCEITELSWTSPAPPICLCQQLPKGKSPALACHETGSLVMQTVAAPFCALGEGRAAVKAMGGANEIARGERAPGRGLMAGVHEALAVAGPEGKRASHACLVHGTRQEGRVRAPEFVLATRLRLPPNEALSPSAGDVILPRTSTTSFAGGATTWTVLYGRDLSTPGTLLICVYYTTIDEIRHVAV
ncbi:hypothetical protein DFH07DRAFT_1063251 [Mycena maculata]|uniref:Uncharacterized protein n=1 Tax=Mycena maculata TaxID=230809 RepID=A0AAD7IKZ7_9AGAR|nr:hypothetical protein DFH07DRAFT_1063251 [Mycena maculata]